MCAFSQMLDVVLDVFNNGGSEKLDMPQPPSALVAPSEFTQDKSNLSKADKAKIYRMKLLHKQKQNEMYSLWCDALYRLSLANHVSTLVYLSKIQIPKNLLFEEIEILKKSNLECFQIPKKFNVKNI